MNQFSEMEWNSKWDWENLVMCGSKSIESPKKLQLADCMIVDDGETDVGSFNLSAGYGNSGASGSDSGHVYSCKSSISASTDSSTKDGMQTPRFRLMSFEGFSRNVSNKMEQKVTKLSGTFPHLDSSIGSGEQLIGLKLGKRTYFENCSAGSNVKNASFPVMPTPSNISAKKTKSSGQMLPPPRCAVEGCNIDLSTAKEYHQKHRVCESHSKCPKVIVGGLERRFCQQCSRFHSLAEFDEKKRSCRRRLSDHNARRRKPKQETIQFNSTRLSSPLYEGRQQMSLMLNNASVINFRSPASTVWTNTCNSKFTLTKGSSLKANVDEGTEKQMHMLGIKLPHITNMHDHPTNAPEVLNPGSEGSLISSHVDAAPEYSRALSLLSTNSWGSCGPESVPAHHATPENGSHATQHAMIINNPVPIPISIPDDTLLSSSEFWPAGHHQSTMHPRVQSSSSSGNFQEMQLFKTPYEADLYFNILN